MSGKRGLSLEDKRAKVLEVFHETKSVFQLKEVEKLAGKKGVTFQSIKDVVQSLVDDDLVHQEKIGQTNYLWSFPSEASVKIENAIKAEKSRYEDAKRLKAELVTVLEEAKAARDDADETREKLKGLEELSAREGELMDRLRELEGCDSIRFASICAAIQPARDAANRWLDNIENLKDWTKRKFDGKDQEVEDFFSENGLKEDMEVFG